MTTGSGQGAAATSRGPGPAEVARAFHEAHERLAPSHGYETRPDSAVPWEQVPERNRALMTAVVADLVDRGVIAARRVDTAEQAAAEAVERVRALCNRWIGYYPPDNDWGDAGRHVLAALDGNWAPTPRPDAPAPRSP